MQVIVIRVPHDLIAQEAEDRKTEGWCVQDWRDDGEVIMVRMPVSNSKERHFLGGFYAALTVGIGDLSDNLQKLHIRPEVDRSVREQVAQIPIMESIDIETNKEFKVSADRSKISVIPFFTDCVAKIFFSYFEAIIDTFRYYFSG